MIIDLHCDTIQRAKDENLSLTDSKLAVNLKETQGNLPYIQCMGTFINPKYNIKDGGFKRTNSIIDNFYELYKKEQDKIYIIKNKKGLISKEFNNKTGVILTIENGSAISSNLDNIKILYKKGIRMMGTVWNEDNELASGANTKNDKGLTELGKKYIQELEKNNIIIDVSHMSKKSFYDTLNNCNGPIIASHSCTNAICQHYRNLDDEQIKQIAKRNGTIGICFYNLFLTKEPKATVKDLVKHIDYIANLVGIDYISIGTDFDGVEKEHQLEDIKSVKDMYKLILELEKQGYSEIDIEKITSKNFLRVANEIL